MRKILVLDDDPDLGLVICELVHATTGVECLSYRTLDELAAHAADALSCDLAILDVNLGPGSPSGIDAREWLSRHGFAGRVVFLTGHARDHPLVQRAWRSAGVSVLEKPVDPGRLTSLVAGP